MQKDTVFPDYIRQIGTELINGVEYPIVEIPDAMLADTKGRGHQDPSAEEILALSGLYLDTDENGNTIMKCDREKTRNNY